MGGITITDPQTGIQATIKKYDLFHSLLGEMKPGSIKSNTKGGHLMIPELKAALLEIGEITPLKHGFFDINIKAGSNKKINSCFPLGTSVDQAMEIIEDAIINYNDITVKLNTKNSLQHICELKHHTGHAFSLRIQNNIAQFYPWNN